MFEWFRKKTKKDEDTEAFKLGRRMMKEITSSFEEVMESRFGNLHDGAGANEGPSLNLPTEASPGLI